MGKFIQFQGHSGAFDTNSLVSVFFNFLPLAEDYTEGPNVYGLLVSLVESAHPAVLGDNGANLPKLMQVFANTIKTDYVNPEIAARMQAVVKQMFAQMPPPMQQALISALSAEDQAKLQQMLA